MGVPSLGLTVASCPSLCPGSGRGVSQPNSRTQDLSPCLLRHRLHGAVNLYFALTRLSLLFSLSGLHDLA